MDVAGLTIALIGVCAKLYGTIQAVKNAPEDVKKLVAQLDALKSTLEPVRSVVASGQQLSVLEKINTEVAACLKDLEKLDSRVCASSRGFKGAIKEWRTRFKWPLKESETQEYISKIDDLKSHLIIALQAHQMALDKEEVDRQNTEREQQRAEREKQVLERQKEENRHRDDKRQKVLKWVYERNCNERHIHIQSRRKEGTGQWLFKTLEFQQWMERNSSPVLLGCGIPGAGKTFLSSMVIDHLLDQQSHEGVAYIYFGYQDQLNQKPIDIISSFTKQLLGQLPELPPDIESSYDRMEEERPNYETLKGFLFSMPGYFASHGRRTFIVCDALDEMHEYDQRQELLPLFHHMKDGGFEIFLTSRPHPADVRISFADAIQFEVTPHQDDL
ncbi:hypothetical protein BDD12DRAFT_949430 [Trichophaea hybrida]|nr:hypothetical protein BDD12DRAFT_949430 [Trichophaea hybrida]